MSVIDDIFAAHAESNPVPIIPLGEYLGRYGSEEGLHCLAAVRMSRAIGPGVPVDTSADLRLGNIFGKRKIRTFAAFDDLDGIEDTIQTVVEFFENAAKGLVHHKQMLYLYGGVGSGKSTIIERCKTLFEREPMHVLCTLKEDGSLDELSPIYEGPFGLFYDVRAKLERDYKVPAFHVGPPSLWALNRFHKLGKNIKRFGVATIMPSMVSRIGIAKMVITESKSVDHSGFVGRGSGAEESDYVYTGSLNRTTQGFLEIFEMNKGSQRGLTPILSATEERKYAGGEGMGELPYQGLLVAHSNYAEWVKFRDNVEHAAWVDRIMAVKVPYCLRLTEEAKTYRRYLSETAYAGIPCVPGSLELVACATVLGRLPTENREDKLVVYDGFKGKKGKTAEELRLEAKPDEGTLGVSSRTAFKIIPEIAQMGDEEIGLDPVKVLESFARAETRAAKLNTTYKGPSEELTRRCKIIVADLLKLGFVGDHDAYVDAKFGEYFWRLDAWIEGEDFKNPDTQAIESKEQLGEYLSTVDSAFFTDSRSILAFRNEVQKAVIDLKAGKMSGKKVTDPIWTALKPETWRMLEEKFLPNKEQMLEVIGYEEKKDAKAKKEHEDFVVRACKIGMNERQLRRIVEWYVKNC